PIFALADPLLDPGGAAPVPLVDHVHVPGVVEVDDGVVQLAGVGDGDHPARPRPVDVVLVGAHQRGVVDAGDPGHVVDVGPLVEDLRAAGPVPLEHLVVAAGFGVPVERHLDGV